MNEKNKTYLITTGLKDSWPINKSNSLFISSWCFNSILEEKNQIVFDHPWDNRKSCFEDYKYINNLKEKILDQLTINFNIINKTNKPKKYWKIILGPWLLSFVTICLNHWRLINHVYKNSKNLKTLVCKFDENNMILNDMKDIKKLYLSDEWNHFLFFRLINFINTHTNESKIDIEFTENKISTDNIYKYNLRDQIKIFLNNLNSVNLLNKKKIDHYFYNSYINKYFLKKLQSKIKNFESKSFKFNKGKIKIFKIDLLLRDEINIDVNHKNNFEKFLFKFLPCQIPKNYLEGFKYLKNESNKLFPNKINKTITTAIDHYSDDKFKIWLAKQNNLGVKVYINQHGGSFGMLKWYQFENHSFEIADKFLTWGWSRKEKSYPLSASKFFENKFIKRNRNENILLVYFGINKYPISHDSVPFYSNTQRNSYEEDQIIFIKNLSVKLSKMIKVRLYPNKYAPNDKELLKKNFPNIKIDLQKNFLKSLKNCKIFIGTYNSTTYLESIFYNIPTIFFWNSKHWEMHEDAKPYFNELKKLKIFHDSPESAAIFLNSIWDQLDEWWYSESIQKSINNFKSIFIADNNSKLKEWIKLYN